VGGKGKGKSTWTRSDLERAPREASIVIWDPKIEYPARLAGRSFTSSPSPLAWLRGPRPTGPIAVRFQAAPRGEADVLAAIAACRPPCVVVLEEVQLLCGGGRAPGWLMDWITTARHHATSITATSQRPALVPKEFVANADRVVAFGLGYADDRDALLRSCGDERVHTLTAGLAPGQHLILDGTHTDERAQGRRNPHRDDVDSRRHGSDLQGPPRLSKRRRPEGPRRRARSSD
jgi:hypothetical protein